MVLLTTWQSDKDYIKKQKSSKDWQKIYCLFSDVLKKVPHICTQARFSSKKMAESLLFLGEDVTVIAGKKGAHYHSLLFSTCVTRTTQWKPRGIVRKDQKGSRDDRERETQPCARIGPPAARIEQYVFWLLKIMWLLRRIFTTSFPHT